MNEAAIGRDFAGMHPVVNHADAEKQRGRDQPVAEHLEHRPFNPLRRQREDAKRHVTHMGDRGIGDQFLHIFLNEGDKRGINDRAEREEEHEGRKFGGGHRKHRQRKP